MRTRRDPIRQTILEQARELRSHPAAAERTAWNLLRNRQLLGLKFRRQHPVGRFIVDFYCAELRLVLEIDGAVHRSTAKSDYDRARSEWLAARGLRVIRMRSADVSQDGLTRVLEHERSLRSPSPHRGEGVRG
jgi:very-short-patch-repair endonuclease